MRKFIIAVTLALVVALAATTTDVWTYGQRGVTQNGGIVLRNRVVSVCVGFEVFGKVGVFTYCED